MIHLQAKGVHTESTFSLSFDRNSRDERPEGELTIDIDPKIYFAFKRVVIKVHTPKLTSADGEDFIKNLGMLCQASLIFVIREYASYASDLRILHSQAVEIGSKRALFSDIQAHFLNKRFTIWLRDTQKEFQEECQKIWDRHAQEILWSGKKLTQGEKSMPICIFFKLIGSQSPLKENGKNLNLPL